MTRNRHALFFAAALFTAGLATPPAAQAAIIPVVADTEIYTQGDEITNGYGNGNAGATVDMYAGYAGFTRPFKILMRFDFSSIPADQVITSATLHLTPEFATSITLDLHRLLVSWDEGNGNYGPTNSGTTGATWFSRNKNGSIPWDGSNPWTAAGASGNGTDRDASAISFLANNTDPAVNVLSDVAYWYANPAANFGWVLDTQDGTGYVAYYTKENGNPARDPYIDVTYAPIPEPASLALLALGATTMLRRRQHSS